MELRNLGRECYGAVIGQSLLPAVHHVCESIFHSVAILLNVGLLVLVGQRSAMRYKDYKYVIQLSCISDIVVSIAYLLCQPVRLFCPGRGRNLNGAMLICVSIKNLAVNAKTSALSHF